MGSTPILPPAQPFGPTRAAFLDAAQAAGAALDHHPHPLAGPDGEAIGTDVARLGPPPGQARSVVVLASGTHGVEGHAGSGLQQLALNDERCQALAPDVAVVMVHAVNPYGLAWSRRVDHENIDVNRNFVDFATDPPTSPHYPSIDPVLNPPSDTFDPDDTSWLDALLVFAGEVGMEAAFQTVSGGQYEHPTGMQFGGTAPSWSRRTLETIWRQHLADAELVVNLDVHTGLGPRGQLTLFQTANEHEPAAEIARRWFPDVLRYDRTDSEDSLQRGVLGPGLDTAVGVGTVAVPVVVEFGTLDELVVLGAMRADNWLHAHGDAESSLGEEIRRRTRAAFFVDDDDWRSTVAEAGLAQFHAGLEAAVEAVGRPARSTR